MSDTLSYEVGDTVALISFKTDPFGTSEDVSTFENEIVPFGFMRHNNKMVIEIKMAEVICIFTSHPIVYGFKLIEEDGLYVTRSDNVDFYGNMEHQYVGYKIKDCTPESFPDTMIIASKCIDMLIAICKEREAKGFTKDSENGYKVIKKIVELVNKKQLNK